MKRITILILAILLCVSGLAESTTWFCPNDGSENNGNFCMECGGARPTGWTCPNCGTTGQNGNFCMECGAARPQDSSPETVFMCEGAGFDSPDDAVQSYIDALNAGDVPVMLSTFAIETYYPSEAYITWLNLTPEAEHVDTIDCRDLFNRKDERERIEVFRLREIYNPRAYGAQHARGDSFIR